MPITILKSKLRSSNPFQKAKLTNENRQIAAESQQKIVRFNSINSTCPHGSVI